MKSKEHSHLGKIFISHTAVDKQFVRRLKARVEAAGYDVWLDEHDLLAGDPLAEQIGEALKRAKVVLVVVSKASVASRWLRYELNIATQRMIKGECRVIPVVIDGSELPPEVRGLLYADCRSSLRGGWKSIETALQHEAKRRLADQSFYRQADRLVKCFFTTGFTFTLAEYGGDNFNIISLDVKDQEGNDIDAPYDTVDSYTTPATPLADNWWSDYSTATERMPHPYSFIVSNRPVHLPFDVVHPETSRVGLRSSGSHGYEFGEHHVVFVDLSGISDDTERSRLMRLVRSFLNSEAAKRFNGRANTALQPTSRALKTLAKSKKRAGANRS
jgi:hypothetical protein